MARDKKSIINLWPSYHEVKMIFKVGRLQIIEVAKTYIYVS